MGKCINVVVNPHTMSEQTTARERLGSRLGFILLTAGCAIGLGNVWKFPYMVGQYGGGAFVLIYLIFLIAMGIPLMSVELSLGRASQKSPSKMYYELEPRGSKWHLHGYICTAGCYVLMAFYTVVTGWIIKYLIDTATGRFSGLGSQEVADAFAATTSDTAICVGFTILVVIIGFIVCMSSLQKGLERISKYMMGLMLVILISLAVYCITLPGAGEGLSFYLIPDFERLMDAGLFKVIVAALSQAFFTLSIGIGSIEIFGSYLDKKNSLLGESARIAGLDLFVAFASGLIIFPACFTYGVEATSGPGLIFVTLPNVFNNMPSGQIIGVLFFVFMAFASLTTVFAVFESIVSNTREMFNWSRKKSALINCVFMCILILPCALGFGVLSGIEPLGAGTNIMDLEDFIVSYLMLPIGALIFVLFVTSRYGWGWKNFLEEVNSGTGLKVQEWMRSYMTYILPLVIIFVLITGITSFFI